MTFLPNFLFGGLTLWIGADILKAGPMGRHGCGACLRQRPRMGGPHGGQALPAVPLPAPRLACRTPACQPACDGLLTSHAPRPCRRTGC